MLSIFGPLPNLAYLHFARRAEANEDNDILFVDEIRSILAERSHLASLVVSIFPVEWRAKETARESHIWQRLSELEMEDKRLILVIGGPGQWRAEYEGSAISSRANFWDSCRRNKAIVDSSRLEASA
ncbi:hypothetical protein ONZ45_g19716 [Pleurotus djamor]|nr:hypothetical protein ONZ45_g19716 [Pleurotus djamor]